MSGHNKWSKIHRQKSVADNKRGALFTKLGNAISLAARQGGTDPLMNFKLQIAITQAKAVNMPKDNIERAVKRGSGELADGKIEEVLYEGFGPGGAALLIECLTDNRNRTAAEIKFLLSRAGGSLGGPNSVAWMFEQKGVITLVDLSEALELELIDAGALDVNRADQVTVYTAPTNLKKIAGFLKRNDVAIQNTEIQYVAKEPRTLDEQTKAKLVELFNSLDENQDVSNCYTNAADQ
jgi:YebC/PmpR family DNA-binding regulatory protein